MEAEPCLGLCHKGAIFHLQSTVLVTFAFIKLQIDQQREGPVSAAIELPSAAACKPCTTHEDEFFARYRTPHCHQVRRSICCTKGCITLRSVLIA